MMKLEVYKDAQEVWHWRIIKEVGPALVIVAESGHAFSSQQEAMTEYSEMTKWICQSSTLPIGGAPA
jgi:hypothetical protein